MKPRSIFIMSLALLLGQASHLSAQSTDLSAEMITASQGELAQRMEADQAAANASLEAEKLGLETKPELEKRVENIQADNLAYLRDLVDEVGWIDLERFGLEAATDAVLILQHGNDVELAKHFLPYVLRDFGGNADAPEIYAVLVDWLRLEQGGCQLYGSRFDRDEDGAPVLQPLADPERVDEYRRAQKMPPLEEYLGLVSQFVFEGQPFRWSPDDWDCP